MVKAMDAVNNRYGDTREDVVCKEAASYFEGEQNTYDPIQPLFEDAVTVLYVESWQKRKDCEKRILALVVQGIKRLSRQCNRREFNAKRYH